MWAPFVAAETRHYAAEARYGALPAGFEWFAPTDEDVAELHRHSYVADRSGRYRLRYTREQYRDWRADLRVGVRTADTRKPVGVLLGRHTRVQLDGGARAEWFTEVNFASVHRGKLRGKRLLAVMTRRLINESLRALPEVQRGLFTAAEGGPRYLAPLRADALWQVHLRAPRLLAADMVDEGVLWADPPPDPPQPPDEEPAEVTKLGELPKVDYAPYALMPDLEVGFDVHLRGAGKRTYAWPALGAFVCLYETAVVAAPRDTEVRVATVAYLQGGTAGADRVLAWAVRRAKEDGCDLLYAYPRGGVTERDLERLDAYRTNVRQGVYTVNHKHRPTTGGDDAICEAAYHVD